MNTGTKLALDLGPLVLFFAANWFGGKENGVFLGTAVFMVAVAVALAAQWWLARKLSPVTLISAVFVAVFGALTLWYHEQAFIQIKVTLINALFGAVLLGGLAFGRSYLKLVMDSAMHMPDAAWRTLTLRWGLFFIALALCNEFLRHSLDWDRWLAFKTFGILPLTLLFAFANAPFMAKHMHDEEAKRQG
jgi:intracellular septation protein